MTTNAETVRTVLRAWDASDKGRGIKSAIAAKVGLTHSTISAIIRDRAKHEARLAREAAMFGGPVGGSMAEATPIIRTEEVIRIAVIPDVQARPGDNFDFLEHIGRYIAEKKPQVIVCIGDFADMPSLSSHDQPGAMSVEGRRYHRDIECTIEAMQRLLAPIRAEAGYNPRMVMTLGNHEHRITRAIENNPKLFGTIQLDDLRYEEFGWEVIPFLKPIEIHGIMFCHYFQTGQMGRPASSARAMLNKQHMSCFAGHQQGRQMEIGKRGDGRQITAIICGSCYEHDEDYLSPQTNNHFRGMYFLNDVRDGEFEEMPLTLRYLRREYGDA